MSFKQYLAQESGKDDNVKKFNQWWAEQFQANNPVINPIGAANATLGAGLQNVFGALGYGVNRLPGGGRQLFSSEAEVPLENGDFRKYLEDNTNANWVASLVSGVATDPLSYVGGPLGRAAGAGASVASGVSPRIASALTKVQVADQSLAQFGDEVVGRTLGGAKQIIEKTDVGRKLLAKSPTALMAQWADKMKDLTDSIYTQDGPLGREYTWDTMLKRRGVVEIKDEASKKFADSLHAKGMQGLEERLEAIDNGINKYVATDVYARVKQRRDAIFKDAARRANELVNDTTLTDPVERGALTGGIWQAAYDEADSLIDGAFLALDKLESKDWAGVATALQTPAMQKKMREMSDYFSTVIQQGKTRAQAAGSLADAFKTDSLIKPKGATAVAGFDPWDELLRAYPTGLPKDARQKQNAIDSVVDGVYRTAFNETDKAIKHGLMFYGADVRGVAPEVGDFTRSIFEDFAKSYGDLNRSLLTDPEFFERAGPELGKFGRENMPYISKALASLTSSRARIVNRAMPFLAGLTPDEQAAAMGSTAALKKALAVAGAPAQEVKAISDMLDFFTGRGDIMSQTDSIKLVNEEAQRQYAKSFGIKKLPSWWLDTMNLWKESSLVSVAYNVGNLATNLMFAARSGIPAGDVLDALRQSMSINGPKIAQALKTGDVAQLEMPAKLMPLYRDLGLVDEAGNIIRQGTLARTTGTNYDMGMNTTRTAWGRMNPVATGAIFGAPTAIAASMTGDDTNEAAMKGVGVGAAAAVAMPRLTAVNRMVAQLVDNAARDAAAYTVLAEKMPGAISTFKDDVVKFTERPKKEGILDVNPGGLPLTGPTPIPGRVSSKGPLLKFIEAHEATGAAFSPEEIRKMALQSGFEPMDANALSGLWRERSLGVLKEGSDLANKIAFDYADVNNMVDWARNSGVLPFVTWQTKAFPIMTSMLLSNPIYYILYREWKEASRETADREGLTSRFDGKNPVFPLDALAEQMTGVPSQMHIDPINLLFPLLGSIPDNEKPDYGTAPASRLLNEISPFVGVNPLIPLALSATPLGDEYGGNISRASGYVEGITGTQVEAPLRAATGATARALGADRPENLSGSLSKDAAIRNRIDMLYYRDGNKGRVSGQYLRAKDDTSSELWKRAATEVAEERGVTLGVGALAPIRPGVLTDMEGQIRGEKKRVGIDSDALEALTTAPATPAEDTAARRVLKSIGIEQPTPMDIMEQVNKERISKRYASVEKTSPMALALSGNSSDDKGKASRARAKYYEFTKRTERMSSAQKKSATAAFMDKNPDVEEWLRETRATAY